MKSASLVAAHVPILEWSFDGGLPSGEYVTPGPWQNWSIAYVRNIHDVAIDKRPQFHVCSNFVQKKVISEEGHYTEYDRCMFVDCEVRPRANTKFKDCLFLRTSVFNVGPGTWFDYCEWRGPSEIALQITGSGVAATNCLFDRTLNGPYIQSTYGEVTDVLIAGLITRDLTLQHNGGDGVGVEGPGFVDRLAILHCRHHGNGAAVNIWDTNVGRVRIYDLIGNRIDSFSPGDRTVQELDLGFVRAEVRHNNVVSLKEFEVSHVPEGS